MCGICGLVGIGDEAALEQMAACQAHRGPDERGVHADRNVRLSNQRLSVIDVEGGDQPIYNESEEVVTVYNGEIYNFRELRAELEDAGHRFTTRSDTEVLVHGYEEWGAGVFERLNGMFAVALWDTTDERLLLARDRAGIKPLYLAPADDGFVFASEPKGILRSGLVEPAVDRDALTYFLQLRYAPSETTLFEGIEPVAPGTILTLTRDGDGWTTDTKSFWSIQSGTPSADPETAVRKTLKQAVDRQLVSDVPVGFYLSGGLDTSSVVAMASELRDEPIHTFCMGFEDQRWDEREDARAVASHFGTEHHEIALEGNFMQDYPRMIWHADEPKRNLYPYYVAEAMRDHVKVALGGLGADELFGGYVYRFNRLAELASLANDTPTEPRHTIQDAARRVRDTQVAHGDMADDDILEDVSTLAALDDPASLYVLLNSTDVIGNHEYYEERMFGEELGGDDPANVIRQRRPPAERELDLRNQALRWDFRIKLPGDFLHVEDRMSMAHGLESRVPFLDNDLIDLAFSLPLSSKFGSSEERATVGKTILRNAMRDHLPEAVFTRDKQGFTMPTFRFARDELLPHADSILDDAYVVREGFIDRDYLDAILDRRVDESLVPHYKFLWKVVGTEIWYQQQFLDGPTEPGAITDYY